MLLVLSGLEENPGPAQHTLEDHPLEDWELVEVVTEMDELKTKRTKCAVCGIGDKSETRSCERRAPKHDHLHQKWSKKGGTRANEMQL